MPLHRGGLTASRSALLLFALGSLVVNAPAQQAAMDVNTIVQRSVDANDHDFEVAPQFNYHQRDKSGGVSRTSSVTMIDGSPYQRLLAINGEPLDARRAGAEEKKQRTVIQQRGKENSTARKIRIDKYNRERTRDHLMMSQLTKAFTFKLAGEDEVRGFKVWDLKAVPRSGYHPPNLQAQVLPGMRGEMWIDQKTFEWVKVTAEVVHKVAIEGFLAEVQPGTEFEIEKSPVADGVWQITHFSSHARAKVLHMFSHNEDEDVTYFDFEKVKQ